MLITGFYRAWFTRAEYRPAPGWLCGQAASYFTRLLISREDGSGAKVINTLRFGGSGYSVNSPRWSPDGTKIAFASAGSSLVICNADGSGARAVTTDRQAGSISSPAWTPDGNAIYFISTIGSQSDLCVIDVTYPSSQPAFLTNDADDDARIDISPDGRWIAWSRRSGSGSWDLYRMPITGDVTRDLDPLANTSDDEIGARWSPDGRYIAYIRGNHSVYVVDVLLPSNKQLTNPSGADDTWCDWSADGRYVLFLRGGDLYRIPFDGDPGDEQLVKANWGFELASADKGVSRYRVLIGPNGSDWGGANPPFGTKRPGIIAVYSAERLVSAVSFLVDSADTLLMTDRTPPGSDSLAVCEVQVGHLHRVFEENGPGIPRNVWALDAGNTSPGAALVIFNAQTGKVSSVVALWDQVGSSAVNGPRVALENGQLVVHGDALRVYDAHGEQVSRPSPVACAVLDATTGEPVLN